ncbi:P-loop NTPase fold protein [Sphaerisporangium sp. TRM90804]|uniref:P-loop NTPase fold protein n=1 Tax=Sphaerisporangium sp. TRM90804 TaxID=3031113 RepID=UPI00244C402D|nr:P-loop NTPase fold protein [Sphaerisporangium sp. TRM90804]MDH2424529.1 P-loop NTPase fold protein [Sphaerisporangium sp. TRM90804]
MTSMIVSAPPAPTIRTRRALVFLDRDDGAERRGAARPGTGADRRLVHALSSEGYAVETAEGDAGDHRRVASFLDAVQPGDLLLIRWSTESGWGRREFGALMSEFARRVERSDGAALLLVVDFGWLVTANPDGPHEGLGRLRVRGEPVAAAAALTTSATMPGERPGGAVSLTAILADGILSGEADLDRDGTVSVGDLFRYAEERCAEIGADRRPYLLTYGEGELIGVAATRGPARDLGPAFGTALARLAVLGDTVPPASAAELVGRVYEVHLSEDARQLLRRAALLAEDEPLTPELARLLAEEEPPAPDPDARRPEGTRPEPGRRHPGQAPPDSDGRRPAGDPPEPARRGPAGPGRRVPAQGAARGRAGLDEGGTAGGAEPGAPGARGGAERALLELADWGLLGRGTPFADPAVRREAARRLEPEEQAQVSAALRRRRAARRAVRPRARLTGDRWTTHDQLGHRVHAEAVAAFIRHPDTRPPLTIGIKGPWGAGKTSLMRMVQDLLDPGAAEDRPAEIHLARLPRGTARLTNAQLLAEVGAAGDRHGAERAVPGELPMRDGDWRPTVWFNPWMYQNGEQVWAGLAHEIISQVTGRLPRGERERFWLTLNLSRVDREAVRRRAYRLAATRLLPVALGFLAALLVTAVLASAALVPAIASVLRGAAAAIGSGGTLLMLGAAAVRLTRFLRESADTAFGRLVRQPDLLGPAPGLAGDLTPDPGYRAKTGFLHLVQTDMRRVLGMVATVERPLVVFVDDLDRCSPGTVAQVIEAVNLFLAGEFPNCVFVLAMEPEVVAAHVEVAYADLARSLPVPAEDRSGLGWRFLEKIVQLPLSVPLLDDADRVPAFLRTLLGVPSAPPGTPEPAAPAASVPDPGLVDRMEAAIRALSPTADDLDAVARRVQADALERPAPRARAETGDGPGPRLRANGRPAPRIRTKAAEGPALRIPLDAAGRPVPRLRARAMAGPARWMPANTPGRPASRADGGGRDAWTHGGPAEDRGLIGGLSAAARLAADRVYDDLYSDQNAYDAIRRILPTLTAGNPRELKRYVNVFRFYSFVTYRHTLAGAPRTGEDEIAKLAMLTIRWPHLLSALAREQDSGRRPRPPAPAARGRTVLEALEEAASGDDGEWARVLTETGLLRPPAGEAFRWEALRTLLSTAPSITRIARDLL